MRALQEHVESVREVCPRGAINHSAVTLQETSLSQSREDVTINCTRPGLGHTIARAPKQMGPHSQIEATFELVEARANEIGAACGGPSRAAPRGQREGLCTTDSRTLGGCEAVEHAELRPGACCRCRLKGGEATRLRGVYDFLESRDQRKRC
ncbi:hypothetical protein NDU88_000747 [Pleurodeles waltl]|uniref:Uncharacterized protein n=1 Tax=Pleurodeles waltl TaxID=8319 RepID=A0AAV7U4L6_PLEWA|nr:hypothetical protein NDU88_000747 [Pleurodeles waltl]